MTARFTRRPAPSPTFNRGWRLGVVISATGLIWFLLAVLLGLVKEVCCALF